jgi:hypothetical protein
VIHYETHKLLPHLGLGLHGRFGPRVLLDLDRPHEGLIRVSQSPMLHLKQIMDRDPEARP